MKKIFIIICGILVMDDAFAVTKPKIAGYNTDWNVGGGYTHDEYSTSTSNNDGFASSWQLNSNMGTYGQDEGSIVVVMAREIWKNGGYFCTTQIQHANAGADFHLDYYNKGTYKCLPVCKSGFSGDGCATQGLADCDTQDYTNVFGGVINNNELRIMSGGAVGRLDNDDIYVFEYDNNINKSKKSYAVVLGVLKVRPHSLTVAPIRVDGDAKNRNNSWIESVKSNEKHTVLCAPGYVLNATRTDCEPSTQCNTSLKLNNLCPGYASAYDSTKHILDDTKTGGCYKFKCLQTGYGFKTKNDFDCMECPGGALAYIDADGLCNECPKGQYPNESRTGCLDKNKLNQYSKVDMQSKNGRQCWLETTSERFAGCVNGCSGSTECWKDGNCAVCD